MLYNTPVWFKDEVDVLPGMEHHSEKGTIWSMLLPFRTIVDHHFHQYICKVYVLVRPDGNELWSKGEHEFNTPNAPGCSLQCVIGHLNKGDRGRKHVLAEDLPT